MSPRLIPRLAHAVTILMLAGRLPVAQAQQPPINGIRPADPRLHALTGATVILRPGQRLDKATIIIRDGVIEAVGADLAIPPGARLWPVDGMTIYPGLIDAAVLLAPARLPSGAGAHWNERVHPQVRMANEPAPPAELRKEFRGLGFTAAAFYPSAGDLRGSGVVLALADEPKDLLAYSTQAAMAAGFDYGGAWETAKYPGSLMGAIALIRQTLEDARWHAACREVWAGHPTGHEPPPRADALEALGDVVARRQPLLFEVTDEHNALRAAKIIDEFKLHAVLLGSGLEFRRLREIAALRLPMIVPLRFPDPPRIASLEDADRVTLRDMQSWEQAPTNPRRLIDAGVSVALTTHRLKSRSDFPQALRAAIRHGLSEDDALAALTSTPARLLGLDHVLGTIEQGKAANLVVVDGSLFVKKPRVRETWINGRRIEVEPAAKVKLVGEGTLRIEPGPGQAAAELVAAIDTVESTLTVTLPDARKLTAKNVSVLQERVTFVLDAAVLQEQGFARFSGVISGGELRGAGQRPNGSAFSFVLTLTEPAQGPDHAATDRIPDDDTLSGRWTLRLGDKDRASLTLRRHPDQSITGTIRIKEQEGDITSGSFDPATGKLELKIAMPEGEQAMLDAEVHGDLIRGSLMADGKPIDFTGRQVEGNAEPPFEMPPAELVTPMGEYGLPQPPQPQDVLIDNATIWTCGPEGVIRNGAMLVHNGKIERLFRESPSKSIVARLDAAGKHITPGLIDCHSHTGISGGVNEWTQADTAEVRIGDVVDPDDINWYRELAGGLTACNQLHGSANPIGGQNSVVKLKWGAAARDFPMPGAVGGIKFALGENVIRPEGRYPKTRMGVESFIRDAFTAARDYEAKRTSYNDLLAAEQARAMPPRRDLALDALVEILHHERIIHCHSYRQDEILMLIRVADDFGFRIGTFQHVLEGYKVAEAIARHGAGASSFSDWWGYKVEVQDAIPHNGAMLHAAGALVSFNSDSSELARRMNLEAAKAVRYGGLSPEEALKFVTINPARQLRVDDRIGSLEVGKDADFAIWSGDPLSAYSRCEQTWIDGARHFDLESDQLMRRAIAEERRRLAQKILTQTFGEPEKAMDGAKPPSEGSTTQIDASLRRWMEDQVRLGRDPFEIHEGDCDDAWMRSSTSK